MSGDRRAYEEKRQYRRVVAQEGRAIVEADLNEATELVTEEIRKEALDLVGPVGTPDDGYALSFVPGQSIIHAIRVGPGTMYVGGMRVYLPEQITTSAQPEWLDAAPPATSITGLELEYVYLHLIEQEVSATEDRPEREVAMGGRDGAPRMRLTQHIVQGPCSGSAPTCDNAFAQATNALGARGFDVDDKTMRITSRCALLARFVPPGGPSTPLYLGRRLIRVQISGPDTLLWGYDDVSSFYRVTPTSFPDESSTVLQLASQPVDASHAPRRNQYVEIMRAGVDLGDGNYVVSAGRDDGARVVARITQAYDPKDRTITIDAALPEAFLDAPSNPTLFLRLWQEQRTFDAGTPSELGTWVPLGRTGVEVTLQAPEGSSDIFPVGEFWRLSLRPEAPSQLFPPRVIESPQPPDGPRQWMCLLGIASWSNGVGSLHHDCRQKFDHLAAIADRTSSGGGTVDPTGSTAVARDASGEIRATSFATGSTVASTGVLRLSSAAQSAVTKKSSVNGANNVVGIGFESNDNIVIGDASAAGWVTVKSAASGFRVQDPGGSSRLAVDFGSSTIALSWDVNLGSRRLTNLATPTSASDAVTKAYADARLPIIVSGVASVATSTFTVIGRAQFDPTTFPTGTAFRFQAIVEVTPGQTAEVRLYNVTDAAVISGSTLSTSSTTPTLLNVAVTLPSASKMYEVQLRLAGTPTLPDRATCARAELTN